MAGHETAGEAVHAAARHFAENLHDLLGFTYALHYGMGARLERATSPAEPTGVRNAGRASLRRAQQLLT
ncbi:hypothetical protein ACFY3G_43065 [Streptomyces phaeochromogenes]|uniref:hypothetical protein n=1 Tax=Streptomyces phaeochromogenes TaxID=1923 RepID=UPI0036C403BE